MRITVAQLRRIIKEEVAAATNANDVAGADIADIIGQGTAKDYASVAQIVSDLLNYRYPDHENVDPVEVISDELANVVSDSDEELDFDAFAMAQAVCDEFML